MFLLYFFYISYICFCVVQKYELLPIECGKDMKKSVSVIEGSVIYSHVLISYSVPNNGVKHDEWQMILLIVGGQLCEQEHDIIVE